MKNILFSFIFCITLTLGSIPQVVNAQSSGGVNLGPFSVGIGFCQQVQKLSAILNSYTIVQWPVGGFPGVTMGLLSNTSVVLDFCAYLINLESMNTTNAIFYSANYLNQLTNKKWDDNFKQIDRTWNLANSLYDFESGTQRQGALESASTHREVNDFIKDTDQWYQSRFNNRDSSIKSRGEREQEMNTIARISYQRAIIKEATNCPEPTGTNYAKIYDDNIRPKERDKEIAEEEMQFFREKLYDMGPRFLNNQAELKTYIETLEQLQVAGVSYDVATKNEFLVTYKPSRTKKDSTGKPVQEKISLPKKTQVFTAKVNDQLFTDFRNKHADQWRTWVTAQWVGAGSYGILDNPAKRIEDEFKDLNFQCNRNKIARTLDETKANYDSELDRLYKQCVENIETNQKSTENLFLYYVNEYRNSILKYKRFNADIWSLESKHLGRNRTVNNDPTADGYRQEEIKCNANLEPAEMEKLALKQRNVENELNQTIATETYKQTKMLEAKEKQQNDLTKDVVQKRQFSEERSKADRLGQQNQGTTVTPVRGAVGSGAR